MDSGSEYDTDEGDDSHGGALGELDRLKNVHTGLCRRTTVRRAISGRKGWECVSCMKYGKDKFQGYCTVKTHLVEPPPPRTSLAIRPHGLFFFSAKRLEILGTGPKGRIMGV